MVVELIRHHEVEGTDVLPQAAHRAYRHHPADAEGLQTVDVRPKRKLRRSPAVPASVPREEDDGSTVESADAIAIGRRSEGGPHLHPACPLEPLHLVEATSPDHPHRIRGRSTLAPRPSRTHSEAPARRPNVASSAASVTVTGTMSRARASSPGNRTST